MDKVYGIWEKDENCWMVNQKGEVFTTPIKRVAQAQIYTFTDRNVTVAEIGPKGEPWITNENGLRPCPKCESADVDRTVPEEEAHKGFPQMHPVCQNCGFTGALAGPFQVCDMWNKRIF